MQWYIKVLKQYADFKGRARRKEFWMFSLINFIIIMALQTVMFAVGGMDPEAGGIALAIAGLLLLYALAVFIPSLAVSVRRLHDTNRSGWWLLIGLIPLIGAVVLIIFYVQDSQPGSNQYGENPKGVESPAVA